MTEWFPFGSKAPRSKRRTSFDRLESESATSGEEWFPFGSCNDPKLRRSFRRGVRYTDAENEKPKHSGNQEANSNDVENKKPDASDEASQNTITPREVVSQESKQLPENKKPDENCKGSDSLPVELLNVSCQQRSIAETPQPQSFDAAATTIPQPMWFLLQPSQQPVMNFVPSNGLPVLVPYNLSGGEMKNPTINFLPPEIVYHTTINNTHIPVPFPMETSMTQNAATPFLHDGRNSHTASSTSSEKTISTSCTFDEKVYTPPQTPPKKHSHNDKWENISDTYTCADFLCKPDSDQPSDESDDPEYYRNLVPAFSVDERPIRPSPGGKYQLPESEKESIPQNKTYHRPASVTSFESKADSKSDNKKIIAELGLFESLQTRTPNSRRLHSVFNPKLSSLSKIFAMNNKKVGPKTVEEDSPRMPPKYLLPPQPREAVKSDTPPAENFFVRTRQYRSFNMRSSNRESTSGIVDNLNAIKSKLQKTAK